MQAPSDAPGGSPAGPSPAAAAVSDDEGEPECRICRCTAEEMGEILFAPCQCKGSLQWVHPSCLEQWRQACPTAASRVRCDMCRADFTCAQPRTILQRPVAAVPAPLPTSHCRLEQQAPEWGDVCGPVGRYAGGLLACVVIFEMVALTCGLLVNAIATLCSDEPTHFTPDFELHLNGWTLMLPQGACATVLKRARQNYTQHREINPNYHGSYLSRLLLERCSSAVSHVLVFLGVLVLVLVPMGYLGKGVVWAAAGGSSTFKRTDATGESVKEGEDAYMRHVAWGLDTAHFYLASLVFCISAFFVYLIAISCAFARQNPDRMRCAKSVLTLVVFELCIVAGGYLVKLLALATGVYDSPQDAPYTPDASNGSGGGGGGTFASTNPKSTGAAPRGEGQLGHAEELSWSVDWNHHVLALTAFMPIAHAVFFLFRFRLLYPQWKESYGEAPFIGRMLACLQYPLETWSRPRATLVVCLATMALIQLLGFLGKLALAAILEEDLAAPKKSPEEVLTEGEDEYSALGLRHGLDYTHYFLGFVLLYLLAALFAACLVGYTRYHGMRQRTASVVRAPAAGAVVSPHSPLPSSPATATPADATDHAGSNNPADDAAAAGVGVCSQLAAESARP